MSKIVIDKFDKYFNHESFLEAALIAVGAAKMLQDEEREWLRKLHGAAVQSNNKQLIDAITQTLNAANPTDYSKLNQIVMEAIVKNNT